MPDSERMDLAVLIDADNITPAHADAIFTEIARLGRATVRRIYGDFSKRGLKSWDGPIAGLALLQHQQRSNSKGKNSSDIALVIDAMDLMHKGSLDGVVLVSSDSDFTRLAQRMREEGLEVYGIGERKSVEAFRAACSRFIYIENLLPGADRETEDAAPKERKIPEKEVKHDLSKAAAIIEEAMEYPDSGNWEHLGRIGNRIQRAHPDFDTRTYGCGSLSDLAKKSGRFALQRMQKGATFCRMKHRAPEETFSGRTEKRTGQQ